jgi:predicted outer membrane repeat protein
MNTALEAFEKFASSDDGQFWQGPWAKGQKGRCSMKLLNGCRISIALVGAVVAFVLCGGQTVSAATINQAPIADAGLCRYAAQDPVVLDGTGSYDPDSSGPLSYSWRQISGPAIVITDANTATPAISGFAQTNEIQECEFELVVSDGELTSLPDTVKVIIVPTFSESTMVLENGSFDPHKPTIIGFHGYDSSRWWKATTGGGLWKFWEWDQRANVISFSPYVADDAGSDKDTATYHRCADMIVVYLSAVAPDYDEYIQTMGHSLGGLPAINVARFLNETYKDRRYAINRVTLFDTTGYIKYSHRIRDGLIERVDGEPCWIESYVCTHGWDAFPDPFYDNIFNVAFDEWEIHALLSGRHGLARKWYRNSLTGTDMNLFNNGAVAGAYWSVVGPGKNLQLASTPGVETYKFTWYGDELSGYMDLYDEPNHPGRLPEPVTLVGPEDDSIVDANGAVFSCEESKNAVGYQLLFGPDPHHVIDYQIISDTPYPPIETIVASPFEQTWWTVKVYDRYGSTIYADPIRAKFKTLSLLMLHPLIDNVTTGQSYASIQRAIDEASHGQEIVVHPGIYVGSIMLKGKNLTLKSIDPNDSAVVSQTIITAGNDVITFSDGEDANCILTGITVTGGMRGIHCSGSSPTIRNCAVLKNETADVGAGMYITEGSSPTLFNCIFGQNVASLSGGGIQSVNSSPTFINCTFSRNSAVYFGGGIYCASGDLTLANCILWDDAPDEICVFGDALVTTYSDIQGGFTGEGNIDADPLFADPDNSDYHLKSQAGRWDPASQSWVIDDVTSPCIDGGDPTSAVGLEPLPNGDRINMGAYGGTGEASKSP